MLNPPICVVRGRGPVPGKLWLKWPWGWAERRPLNSSWRDALCDASVITADNVAIDVHRELLSAVSDFFKAAFNGDFNESCMRQVRLPEVRAEVLRPALDFIYNGRCVVDEASLMEHLHTASYLGISVLVDAIVDMLVELLEPQNCLGAISVAEAYGLPRLMDPARRMALRKFETTDRCDELGALSYTQLYSLLSDDGLNIREEVAHEAVVGWAKAQTPPPTEAILLALIKLVRYPLIPHPILEAKVLHEPLLGQGPLMEQVREQLSRAAEVGAPASRHLGTLYVVGGSGERRVSSVDIFDPATDRPSWRAWQKTPRMATPRLEACAAALGGKLYVVGGRAGEKCTSLLSSVEIFDPETGLWQEGVPMSTKRAGACAVTLNDELYVMGGRGGPGRTRHLTSVEIFNLETGSWRAGPKMSTAMACAYAVALGGKLYVVGPGGWSGYLLEIFDPTLADGATDEHRECDGRCHADRNGGRGRGTR